MKSLSLADHKGTKLTNTLTDSTLLRLRFGQLFTLQHRAGGLNLLTRPKSQFGRSICVFVPSGSGASKDWQ